MALYLELKFYVAIFSGYTSFVSLRLPPSPEGKAYYL